eukprot:498693-Pyramimonas_sp.AAC.1
MLRRRLNLLLLAAAFCAWATDGKEVDEWLDYRQAGGGGQCERVPLARCSLMHATQLRMSGNRFSRRQWSLRNPCRM